MCKRRQRRVQHDDDDDDDARFRAALLLTSSSVREKNEMSWSYIKVSMKNVSRFIEEMHAVRTKLMDDTLPEGIMVRRRRQHRRHCR